MFHPPDCGSLFGLISFVCFSFLGVCVSVLIDAVGNGLSAGDERRRAAAAPGRRVATGRPAADRRRRGIKSMDPCHQLFNVPFECRMSQPPPRFQFRSSLSLSLSLSVFLSFSSFGGRPKWVTTHRARPRDVPFGGS